MGTAKFTLLDFFFQFHEVKVKKRELKLPFIIYAELALLDFNFYIDLNLFTHYQAATLNSCIKFQAIFFPIDFAFDFKTCPLATEGFYTASISYIKRNRFGHIANCQIAF